MITIVKAIYGNSDTFVDITKKIRELVKYDFSNGKVKVSLVISNKQDLGELFSDPIQNKKKYLIISIINNFKKYKIITTENNGKLIKTLDIHNCDLTFPFNFDIFNYINENNLDINNFDEILKHYRNNLKSIQQKDRPTEIQKEKINKNTSTKSSENDYFNIGAKIFYNKYKIPDLTNGFRNIFIISNIFSGGAFKYICDIIDTFSIFFINFYLIKNKEDYNKIKNMIKPNDKIIFQYLFDSDFKIDDIIKMVQTHKLELIIPVHDNYFMNNNEHDLYHYSTKVHHFFDLINENIKLLFLEAKYIIFPSKYIFSIFSNCLLKNTPNDIINEIFKKCQVFYHIDYFNEHNLYTPPILNQINIGIITNNTFYKGNNLIENLTKITNHNKYEVHFYFYNDSKINKKNVHNMGKYYENEIYQKLINDNIHGLLFLNNYPETYSYALTKGINIGLPILYTNNGAIHERLGEINNERFIPTNNNDLNMKFTQFLDYILNNKKKFSQTPSINITKTIPKIYNNIFINCDYSSILNLIHEINKSFYEKIHKKIEPYAIYFPQFHQIKENDINFYESYTDMKNLQVLQNRDKNVITPLSNFLGFYDLEKTENIIEKQILMAKSFGFKGFGIYYYWFSKNTLSGDNMIFKKVIDKFFEKKLDNFDVFFIYCNESWTNNIAFTKDNSYQIINEYTEENIKKNINNLIKYFKYDSYKKINNKPVLMLHHPWEMTNEEVDLFYKISNDIACKNGFSGIHFTVNGMHKINLKYNNYLHHCNYKCKNQFIFKTLVNGNMCIDYSKYIKDYLLYSEYENIDNIIHSIFTNFDNTARFLFKDSNHQYITKTINNSIDLFKNFLDIQMKKYLYPRDDINKIFLVNAWNEWGEQMTMEPSNEQGFSYLLAFKEKLLRIFQ